MSELQSIQQAVKPSDTLLVVDAMTGQEAAGLVKAFNDAAPLTGESAFSLCQPLVKKQSKETLHLENPPQPSVLCQEVLTWTDFPRQSHHVSYQKFACIFHLSGAVMGSSKSTV